MSLELQGRLTAVLSLQLITVKINRSAPHPTIVNIGHLTFNLNYS